MEKPSERIKKIKPKDFIENVDYYFDDGLMVLTAEFLKKRGYCCRNGCRHCPFQKEIGQDAAANEVGKLQ